MFTWPLMDSYSLFRITGRLVRSVFQIDMNHAIDLGQVFVASSGNLQRLAWKHTGHGLETSLTLAAKMGEETELLFLLLFSPRERLVASPYRTGL